MRAILFFTEKYLQLLCFRQKTNFLTEDKVEFLWEKDKLNMLADCLNFAFWSAFEEKWWLFHYGKGTEVFLSMCNYINSRACNYTSIYTENSPNFFFFLFLSWSNVLFWCFLLLLKRPKIQSKLLLWMLLPVHWIKKANQNYFQEAIAKESNIKGSFLLEGHGKGEFHASRTGLKSKLSFQDILSLQQNVNCSSLLQIWSTVKHVKEDWEWKLLQHLMQVSSQSQWKWLLQYLEN